MTNVEKQQQQLSRVLELNSDVVFGFLASCEGSILCEVGRKELLPYTSVVDTTARPESIRAFYERCMVYAREAPSLVPRVYAQGQTYGVIGPPEPGLLVALFGVMPEPEYTSSPRVKVDWMASFRGRVWGTVLEIFG